MAKRPRTIPKPPAQTVEACILAGGLSSRMGRDKSRLRIGGRTMLARVRSIAKSAGFPVRVIRKDAIPRCGPIGGIYTALKSSSADTLLFLPCDMPFLSPELILRVCQSLLSKDSAVFTIVDNLTGFPCILRHESALPIVEHQIARSRLSLQSLAKALHARLIRVPRTAATQLTNINTPHDLQLARNRTVAKPLTTDH